MTVRVQEAISTGAELPRCGRRCPRRALASFLGLVRDLNDGASVAEMTLEHYPGMTEKALEAIVAEAKGRWDIYGALVIHRVGPLKPCDQIVLVAVTSAHRGEAFAACEFIMDYLKTRVLEEEATADGGRWVDAGNRRQRGGALAEVKQGSAGSLFTGRKNLSAKSLGLAR
jgi:molybdopterin synthase catalytic subunit